MAKQDISWIAKNVLLPIVPGLLGYIIRSFSIGNFSIQNFSSSELAFAMSVLCVLVAISSKGIKDEDIGVSISSIFTLATFVFVCVFTISVSIEINYMIHCDAMINNFTCFDGGKFKEITIPFITGIKNSSVDKLNSLRQFTFWASGFSVIIAVLANNKFKLA